MHDQNFDRWMPEFNYLSGMNYWTESNPTNEMTSPSYVPYEKHSFYKRMNYVQLKNITIGYNIPKTFTQKLGITSARVDVSVNNVCTFSNIKNALNYDNAKALVRSSVFSFFLVEALARTLFPGRYLWRIALYAGI